MIAHGRRYATIAVHDICTSATHNAASKHKYNEQCVHHHVIIMSTCQVCINIESHLGSTIDA